MLPSHVSQILNNRNAGCAARFYSTWSYALAIEVFPYSHSSLDHLESKKNPPNESMACSNTTTSQDYGLKASETVTGHYQRRKSYTQAASTFDT